MLGTEVKCPKCHYEGFLVINWHPNKPDNGFDPLMVKVKCRECGLKFFVAPPPWYKEKEESKT